MSLRVSVIIPSYKSGAYIEATLDSVRRQTFPSSDLELLLIDDASPDDSVAVARKALANFGMDGRVVVREANGGAAATRNQGWRMASGDWIQFLDQDDILAPHKIALQARCAAQQPDDVAVVYSNWQHLTLEGDAWRPSGAVHAPQVDANPVLQILQQPAFGYVGPTLMRKSFLAAVGGFAKERNIGEDTDLMLRIAMAGGKFRAAASDEAAFFYRQTPNSLWQAYAKNQEAMRNLLYTFRSVEIFVRREAAGAGLPESLRTALAMRYSRFVDYYHQNDHEGFELLMGWLSELGFKVPLGTSKSIEILASTMGYQNALRLRNAWRTLQGSRGGR